jgi:hypothetical protein
MAFYFISVFSSLNLALYHLSRIPNLKTCYLKETSWVLVVHAYNLSNLGSWYWEDHGLRSALAKI